MLRKHEETPFQASTSQGFTLIELSIVLVVIGLIIGVIFVGRDLIRASEIRGTISQIGKYQSAVNAFRLKYNALPGDMTSDAATSFGFTTRLSGCCGSYLDNGDGNYLIQVIGNNSPPGDESFFGGEAMLFWDDLSSANLIDGNFTLYAPEWYMATYPPATTPDKYSQVLPAAKMGNNWITVICDGAKNYFQIVGLTGIGAHLQPNLTIAPIDAFAIDSKMDDGLPLSGNVMSGNIPIWGPFPDIPAAPATGVCVSNATTPSPYNTSAPAFANSPACSLRINGGFGPS